MSAGVKILNGRELAGFIKERQAGQVSSLIRRLGRKPKLLIIRDSDNPVILKYVNLKILYGEDIGVVVEDYLASSSDDIKDKILAANDDPEIDGIILQLPILEKEKTDELTSMILPSKDVDGLSGKGNFDSATATAILWLLTGYDIDLNGRKIALVGRGKLVGAPLYKMLTLSGLNVEMFHSGSDLSRLKDFDVIITATGKPGLILDEYVASGAVIVDAGTASEDGVLKGDVSNEVRERGDLLAITPVIGGVGPLTITCLFDHVIQAAEKA
ncbi:bifunctional 5,10-methylenetetrahydrofolate dehydrogenase/5,10-methenyltetrahydrofolate cyclohydrolase [Candidatus Saccharibacteria bacterium]|nr:bifunctional 5,10-methylenetetrahydrofolate dehydrogenase/5,10-methenyltetrahydrofolate cyclohydrolase [Candidatus Saccharibacteria bacterium]